MITRIYPLHCFGCDKRLGWIDTDEEVAHILCDECVELGSMEPNFANA